MEDRIRIAFGDQKLFAQYTKFLENEKDLFRAVTDVLGNSKTAERGAAIAESALDPADLLEGARQLSVGNIVQGAVNIGKGALRRITTPPAQSEAIAETLTGRSIAGLENIGAVTPLTEQLAPRSIEEVLIRAITPLE